MDLFATVLPLVLIIGVFYFLLYRPAKQRNADYARTQAAIGPGALVMMGGGMLATVVRMDDDEVTVEAAPGVQLRYNRQGVVKVLEPAPGTSADPSDPADPTA
ncbi:MAG: preprotein translocase subunit YajC [Actinomycetia bacterium]|jgi:preprotein translocase subunit YajC|nr:preprotein translocase subunit YajC [Actinomycetes bacterium]